MKLIRYGAGILLVLFSAFAANAQWSLSGNTPSSPTPDFLGTTNTEPVIFKTNNAEAMRILSNGNIGIGTTTPADKLDVNGNIRSSGNVFIGSSSIVSNGSRLIVAGGSTPTATAYNLGLNFYSGAAGRLLTGSESGIGTGVITNLLDGSNIELSAGTATSYVSGVTVTANGASVAPGTVRLWTTGAERFRITPAGNVGIGTTSPTYPLTVSGIISTGSNIVMSSASATVMNTSTASYLKMIGGTTIGTDPGITLYGSTHANAGLLTIDANLIRMRLANGTDIVKINSTGMGVGLGTGTPSAKLDVSGLAIITNPSGNNYDENLRLPAASSGTASIQLGAVAGATGTGIGQWTILKYPSGGNNHRFAMRYNTTDLFTILTSGNVGIGTTSPGELLSVAGNISMTSAIISANVLLSNSAPVIRNTIQNGTLKLMAGTTAGTDPSITLYGSTHTTIPRLIALDGNVAIGTTCVPSGYQVSVKGNIICEKLKVKPEGGNCWADYVFAPEYKLLKLNEVETFIAKNKHLPGVPSAAEVDANGVEMVEMDATLLKKIEELTLYIIDLQKQVDELKKSQQ